MIQPQDHGENDTVSITNHFYVLIALGANLNSHIGTPKETLSASLESLQSKGAVIRAVSQYYNTPAFPKGNGPDYVNAAARIEVRCSAQEVLELCHEVEAEMGRERVQRWGQRTLDIDVIAIDDLVLPDDETHAEWRNLSLDNQRMQVPNEMILPHPRMQDRGFVLVPLADVAPDWVHPILGRTVLEMRDALDPLALQEVKPFE